MKISILVIALSLLVLPAHSRLDQTDDSLLIYGNNEAGTYSNSNPIKTKRSLDSDDSLNADTETEVDTANPLFIFMCIVYTISTLTAIITNLIVILVYILGLGVKTDLSKFLINLAIADFLQSTFCMPFTFAQALLKKWIFGEIMCPIVLFKQVFTVSLSIYTMVAIGIDRYFAIKKPLQNFGSKKGKISIILVWIISISLASVQLFVARIQLVDDEMEEVGLSNASSLGSVNKSTISMLVMKKPKEPVYTCNEVWDTISKQQIYTLFNFFAVYLIPVFILGIGWF